MFTAFEALPDTEAPRRLAISALASVLVLGALAFGAVKFAGQKVSAQVAEKAVDVSFRPPPPPPVPTKIENAPPPPKKIVRVIAPPTPVVEAPPVAALAAAAMVAPKAIPTKLAPEVAPDQAVAERTLAVGGTGDGRGSAVGGESDSAAPVAATGNGGPINLPEDAEPAEPADDNVMPEYPEAARSVGHESVVILKIVIEADGHVGKMLVMKGDEPFLAAALSAVRRWRYEPARLEGQQIAIFKIVKIPFRLKS